VNDRRPVGPTLRSNAFGAGLLWLRVTDPSSGICGTGWKLCEAGSMTPSQHGDIRRLSEPISPPAGAHAELTGDLKVVVGSLHDTYDDLVGAAVVDSEIQTVADRFVGARIRAYVPLFVRRYAGARLRANEAGISRSSARAADALGRA
jgi:hypothetical protein